jgi:hypothetical protein
MTKKLGKAVADSSRLLGDVRSLIVEARGALATAVNAGLTLLYWNIGKRIQQEILKGERAEYGGGFGKRNLFNMLRFVEAFPDERIVHALRAQLSEGAIVKQLVSLLHWSHVAHVAYSKQIPATLSPELILCCDGDKREFRV